jgi:hypothetical protein
MTADFVNHKICQKGRIGNHNQVGFLWDYEFLKDFYCQLILGFEFPVCYFTEFPGQVGFYGYNMLGTILADKQGKDKTVTNSVSMSGPEFL